MILMKYLWKAFNSYYYMFRREEEEEGIASIVNDVVPVTNSSACIEPSNVSDPTFVCSFHQKYSEHSAHSTSILSNEASAQLKNELSNVPVNDKASITFMDTGHHKILYEKHG